MKTLALVVLVVGLAGCADRFCETAACGQCCGASGECVACPDSGLLDSGVASGCGQCSGCCLNGACKVGTAASACGAGGVACEACGDFKTCSNQSCKPSCDDTTCPAGCCSGGACVSGVDDGACGTGGGACFSCGSGTRCISKKCTPVAKVAIRYQYWSGSGYPCPNDFCYQAKEILASNLEQLLSQYTLDGGQAGATIPSCVLRADGGEHLIDCSAGCSAWACGCNPPKYCKGDACSWTPP